MDKGDKVCPGPTRGWRWRELLQMLEVTTIDSHSRVGSQALEKVCHHLVNVFL